MTVLPRGRWTQVIHQSPVYLARQLVYRKQWTHLWKRWQSEFFTNLDLTAPHTGGEKPRQSKWCKSAKLWGKDLRFCIVMGLARGKSIGQPWCRNSFKAVTQSWSAGRPASSKRIVMLLWQESGEALSTTVSVMNKLTYVHHGPYGKNRIFMSTKKITLANGKATK